MVRVIDKGPGVAAEDRDRIFERFVRGSSQRTNRSDEAPPVRGSGIGLALVRHIAESHGGYAWVESELGRGSTFTVSIPAMPNDTAGTP
jgi:two-component system phosphate regulon sensor histidine kinase PhoR